MALATEMTWERSKLRWRKMYRGKVYTVSCKELDLPPTKEASYQAANAWWRAKLVQLGGEARPGTHAVVRGLQKRLDWARENHRDDLANEVAARIVTAKRIAEAHAETNIERAKKTEALSDLLVSAPDLDRRIKDLEDLGVVFPVGLTPRLLDTYLGDGRLWHDRLRHAPRPVLPEEKTVGGQVDAWLRSKKVEAEAGRITAARWDNLRQMACRFREHVGGMSPAASIAEEALESYYLRLLGQVAERHNDPARSAGMSADYAATVFSTAKTFVRYLHGKRLIDLPRNLDSTTHRFGRSPKKIKVFSIGDVRTLYERASGQLKLHVLLMANCGFRSGDIAGLRDGEVDWSEGRIIRKRSKTAHLEDAPTVDYKLWHATFDLLKRGRSGGETVLLTRSGSPWAFDRIGEDGKLKSTDNVQVNFNRLRRNPKVKLDHDLSLSAIRRTSATLIESHEFYGRFTSHFLGHSPRSMKDKHYARPSVETFDTIIDWLGRKYGFVE